MSYLRLFLPLVYRHRVDGNERPDPAAVCGMLCLSGVGQGYAVIGARARAMSHLDRLF